MKKCPQCSREYDLSMSFCLDDGAELLYGPASKAEPPVPLEPEEGWAEAGVAGAADDEPRTAIMHETALPNEAATRAQIHTTEQTAVLPSVTSDVQKPAFDKRLLAAPLLLAIIVVGGFIGYRYFTSAPGQVESIAVMPFVNDSGDPDLEYLSDGMTEMLIGSLSQLPNLAVKARSAVFFYKGKEITTIRIGEELRVQAVLLGRVAQRGDDLKLSLELVNTQTQDVLWSGQYNRKKADLASLQTEIARDVSGKLRTKLSGADEQKVAKTYTTNSEAYQLYLRGRYYWSKRTAENLKKAMEQFQRASDTDPNFALAYSGLADCYVVSGDYTGSPNKETLPKARAFAERALQLDGSLVEAQTSLAYSYALVWQWDRAEIEFRKAFELNPNYATAHHWYSLTLVETGRFEESLKEIKRAQELDPLSAIISYNLALSYLNLGDVNASIEQSKRLIDLDPNFPRAHQSLGLAYLKQQRFPEALAEFQKAVSLSPNDRQSIRDLGYGYAVAGKRAESLAVLKELEANHEKQEAFPADIAAVLAGLGEKDQAFAWLEKDFQTREGRLARIRYHAPYESLRSDPRYADLLRRMGLPG